MRGLFWETGVPYLVLLDDMPVSLRICGTSSLSLLPLWNHHGRKAVRFHPEIEKGLSAGGVLQLPSLRSMSRGREVTLTVGDEAGDALMLDFLENGDSVGNRGTILGVEAAASWASGHDDSWRVRGRYRKDDWLAYHRHSIRNSIAPLDEGRENIGTVEKGLMAGEVCRRLGRWRTETNVVMQTYPALWLRDAGTLRTTKWRGSSGIGVFTARTEWGKSYRHDVLVSVAGEAVRVESIHRDSHLNSQYRSDTENIRLVATERIAERTEATLVCHGQVQSITVRGDDCSRSHGFEGPSSLLSGGVYSALDYQFPSAPYTAVRLEARADKREHTETIWSLGLNVFRQWIDSHSNRGLRIKAFRTGRIADPFYEFGWSRVTHASLGTQDCRFSGRRLKPEIHELAEIQLYSHWERLVGYLTVYHRRIKRRIVPLVMEWTSLGDDRECVRSGSWVNGGQAVSTGAEMEVVRFFGDPTFWGRFSTFVFVRDVSWESDQAEIVHPPLGGRFGTGVMGSLYVPKDVEICMRLRSTDPPAFADIGSWTEEASSNRLRWDVEVSVPARSWTFTIAALDILDDGHIEVPGGNSVGFRVVGELWWRP